MRIARRLFLLCAMALTAMAMMAGTAAAQETNVEVTDEDGAGHCSPCTVHAVSSVDSQIISHVFGHEEVASRCRDEFTAEVYEDGTGHITDQELGPPVSGTCTQMACNTAPEDEWPITAPGETGPGTGHITVRFCLEPDNDQGTERHCNAEVQLEEGTVDPHDITFHTDQHCPITFGVESEVTGRWVTEDTPDVGLNETDIEFTHL